MSAEIEKKTRIVETFNHIPRLNSARIQCAFERLPQVQMEMSELCVCVFYLMVNSFRMGTW